MFKNYSYKGLRGQDDISVIEQHLTTHGKLTLLSPKLRWELRDYIDSVVGFYKHTSLEGCEDAQKEIIKKLQEFFDDEKTNCKYYIRKQLEYFFSLSVLSGDRVEPVKIQVDFI